MGNTTRSIFAHVAAATAALSAGAAVVATRFVVADVDPIELALWRYLIGSTCFLPFLPMLWPSSRLDFRDIGTIALLGVLFFCLFTLGFNAALDLIPAARGAVGLATVPIQTLIVAALFGREPMNVRKVMAVVLAFAGVLTVFGPAAFADGMAGDLQGDVYMLLGVFCAALYSVFSRESLHAHGPLFVTAMAMISGAAALLVLSYVTNGMPNWPTLTPDGWAALLFLGTFAGALQFALFTWALRWLPPSTAVIYIALNPIAATVLGWVLLGELVSPALVVGLILVLAGIGVSSGLFSRR